MTAFTTARPRAGGTTRSRRPWKLRLRVYARSVTDVLLVLAWIPATFTGVILWAPVGLVPEGPGKGERIMLWGQTTAEWGTIHWWLSAAAVAFTLLHIVLDWRAFKGAMKYRGLPS